MKRRATVVAILIAAGSGCSLGPAPPKSLPPRPSPPTGSNRARIGQSIRLTGSEGLAMRVLVSRVLDPAPVGPADATLGVNARLVGIEIELENVGQTPYSAAPLSGAKLVLDSGRAVDGQNVLEGPCAGGFALHAKIAPGQRRGGCLVFEVPESRRPVAFRYALDSGFAEEQGEWKLK
jgi:hypothetical protein